MGKTESDKCIFCDTDLEEWSYGYFEENGERASDKYDENLNICKDCIVTLKKILAKTIHAKQKEGESK